MPMKARGSHVTKRAAATTPQFDGRSPATADGAVSLSVAVTGLAPGVTDVGDMEHDGIGAGPDTEQASETGLEKPPSDVKVRTSVPEAPLCTVKLVAAGLMMKSGAGATSKFKLTELLELSGSGSLAEAATVFVHCPTSVKVTGIVTVAVADAVSVPRLQVICPPEGGLHDPWLVVAEEIAPPPCKSSVRATLLAVAGPLLATTAVRVSCVPAVMLVPEAVCVTTSSAGFTVTFMVALLLSPFRSG